MKTWTALAAPVLALSQLVLLTASADALPPAPLPPAQYDRPFAGKLIVVKVSFARMQRICGAGRWWVCEGFTFGNINGVCKVYVTVRDARLIRHEVGHCNGWPAHHPGARYE